MREMARELKIDVASISRRVLRAREIIGDLKEDIPKKQAKILFWDIETAMMENITRTYQLKLNQKYLSHKGITRPVTIVCASWKYRGKNAIGSSSVLNDKERFSKCHYDDYAVIRSLVSVIEDSDIIVAHNGDKFDWRKFQGRCVYHGIRAPKKPIMIDTLKISRKEFDIESHSLSYLAKYLGVDEKDESPDWGKVFDGDVDEIKACLEYNKQDVLVLEAVYNRLLELGYIRNHPNLNIILDTHNNCKACSHNSLSSVGFEHKNTTKYELLRCDKCNTINRYRVNMGG